MPKRLQVLLDEEEYCELRDIARGQQMTLAEWVRQALRRAKSDHPGSVDAKLRAIAEASRHPFPSGDIEDMLWEIETVRQML